MRYGFPKSPWAHPNGCPKYFVRDRCLIAPKPYMVDGIYDMGPRRRIRPGLLPVPTGFISVMPPEDLMAALRSLCTVRNTNMAVSKLLALTAS